MKPAHLDGVHVVPVRGVPEIVRGDDLAAVLVPYLREADVRDGDVVVVTSKIVSKAEGRVLHGADRTATVAAATARVVGRRGDLVIAETPHGFVCADGIPLLPTQDRYPIPPFRAHSALDADQRDKFSLFYREKFRGEDRGALQCGDSAQRPYPPVDFEQLIRRFRRDQDLMEDSYQTPSPVFERNICNVSSIFVIPK
jgi:hypothetical protein